MIPLIKTRMPEPQRLMPVLQQVLYSGYVAQGERVELFERSFESFVGAGHSLSVNSGTAALHIALILAGVKPGSEVISTALTAEPTNVAIKMAGARIRYADIDRQTLNINPASIRQNISDATSAIMVVDYAGVPVDIEGIQEISRHSGLPVIHDAAHSLGSRYRGRRAGCHFPLTAFSFQAIKHVTTVDGGILQVADKSEYDRGKLIRWFGIDRTRTRLENNIQLQGYKYHMNNVNAAIGIVQLQDAEWIIDRHIDNGQYFDRALCGVPGVQVLNYYDGSEPSYWLYSVLVDDRDGLERKLAEHGISSSVLHRRNDLHDYLNDFRQELPVLDDVYPRLLHLPCGWWVGAKERDQIVDVIRSGW